MARILLLEDESLIAMGLTLSLVSAGFEVVSAPNGQHALRILDEGFKPDVIVTDYMMPVMDGPTFIQALRERRQYDSVPILMVSAIPKDLASARAKYDAYLEKPIRDEQLIALVRELLKNRAGHGSGAPDNDPGPGSDS